MADRTAILLVEDNPNDVELTLHAFEQNKLTNRVTVVRDGEEALDYLFRRGDYADIVGQPYPQLILLDIKMPKVDGLEVLRQIKADPRTRPIPVVALTSSRDEKDIEAAYDLGANSYIPKPVEFDVFVEVAAQLGLYWLMLNTPPNCSV